MAGGPVVVAPIDIDWCELERTGLVDRITAALRAGRSVLLQGEAGAGKTTVARQAAPEESAWLQGMEGLASVPLASFALVGADVALDSVAAASRWLRDLAEAGTVLVVDDAHWIDPAGAALVALAIGEGGIRTILSVRSGHTLSTDLVRALGTVEHDTLTVEPLDASMVELALELTLGAAQPEAVVDTFTRTSGGNPLYLRELVLESVRTGTLRPEATGWALTTAPAASETLTAMLTARLDRHDPEVRRAVALVAVTEHLPLGALTASVDPVHVATALDAGLLRTDGETARPGHPTIRDGALAHISPAGRRALLRAVADATADTTDPSLRARRVGWALELGDVPTHADLDLAYDAAVRAMNLDLAGALARAAHAHYPSVEHGLRAANQLHRDGNHRAALELVTSLRPLAQTADEAARIASHCFRTQSQLGYILGTRPDAADLDNGLIAWADHQLENAPFATFVDAATRFFAGEIDEALAELATLCEHASDIVRYDARELLVWTSFLGSQPADFEAAAALGEVDDPYLDDRPQIAHYLLALAPIAALTGRIGDAYAQSKRTFDRLDEAPSTNLVDLAIAHAALCAQHGQVTEGLDAVRLARSIAARAPWHRSFATHCEGLLRSFAGDPAAAETLLAQCVDTMTEATPGVIDAHLRDTAESSLSFHRAVYRTHPEAPDQLRALGQRLVGNAQVFALTQSARITDVDSELVAQLRDISVQGPMVAAFGAYAAACIEGDLAAILGAADQFEAFGTLPVALEAVTAAIELCQRRGRYDDAAPLVRRHADLLARCPGLRWPLAALAIDAPDLTARERQIAELAALGWSNREIADELSLSVRTIENNLQRAYTKLGVNRRAQLADALSLQPA